MDDERREPIRLVGETADTVTMLRADYEGLLRKLDDAEDRAAVLASAREEDWGNSGNANP
jgi:hypothetical protein